LLKNLSNFKPKIATKLSEIWVLGSGILKKTYPGSGSRGKKCTGSQICNTGKKSEN
jgi:hypothetical protein